MRKRRIVIKPRFWVLVAILMLGSVSLLASGQKCEEKPIEREYVYITIEKPIKDEFIPFDVPLSSELQEELYEASKEFDVDYCIMLGLIEKETKFKNVQGDGGDSYGYCQIQPKWWKGLMADIGATDLNEPKDNFRTACAIMAQLIEKHNSTEGALVAYNQGYYKGTSTSYSRDVIANAEKYRREI